MLLIGARSHGNTNSKIVTRVLATVVIIVSFTFLGKVLLQNWNVVKEYAFNFNYLYLGLSLAFGTLGFIGYSVIWRQIIKQLDSSTTLSVSSAIRIYSSSAITKYIPTSIVLYASRIYLTISAGVSKTISFISVFFEGILAIVGQLLFAAVFLIALPGVAVPLVVLTLVIGIWMAILFRSHHLKAIINFFARFTGRRLEGENIFLPLRAIIRIISLYFINALINGVGFYFLVISFLPSEVAALPMLMGIYIFSGVMGTLVFFVPGGLGIREGLLVALLSLSLPLGVAVVVALTSRVWTITLELLVFGGALVHSKLPRKSQ